VPATMNLQQAVFAGLVNPGNLSLVRDIVKHPNAGDIDTAVYAGPRDAYNIVKNGDGSITVTDTTGVEGADILWNVEQARFSDQTVGLLAAATPVITSSPLAATGLTFAARPVLTTSGTQSVTVTNTGSTPATITLGISAEFAVATDTCVGSPLAPGANCTVNVTFTPAAVGSRTGTLTVTPLGGSALAVQLTGTGTLSAPAVSLSAPLSFGSQNVGVASTAQTVTVTNSGNAALLISVGGATIGGTNAGDFSKSADGCSNTTVAAGASCTVSIRFTPGAAGARSASLSIASNAAGSPHSVALSGTGVVPVAATTITTSATAFRVGGPRRVVGSTSTAVLTIKNGRVNALHISPIQVGPGANPQFTGANANQFFVQSTTCNATIAARGSCTITFAFVPTSAGDKAASFQFSWNGVASPTTISLTGSAR